ncbi:MAG: ATP-binding protein [Gammaproteobacteria bacterium]|nr:ATP-binding protein [Gammaproteobacteria bacterium]
MTSSIRNTLIKRVTSILVITFIAVLSIVAIMIIYTANTNLKNSEKQLFQALVTKGNTLVVNNSQALIEMVNDNSFSAIHNLVSATVANDKDIVYGIFMDTDRLPWTIIYHQSDDENLTQRSVLNDTISLWASHLTQSSHIKINPNTAPMYSSTLNDTLVYEFAAPVMGLSEADSESNESKPLEKQILGIIRYGISTSQLESARVEAQSVTQKIMFLTLFIVLLLAFIVIFLAFLATRYTATLLSQPLAELSQATVDISRGNYDSPIIINSDNEVGVLSQSFDKMRIKIKETLSQLLLNQKDLNKKNERLKVIQNELENLNQHLEDKVNERTAELKAVQNELLKSARAAGMAEIAINVLHNIGNVINSVNVANQDNCTMLKRSRVSGLIKTNELINQHNTNIGQFINDDPRGQKVPVLLDKLGNSLVKENEAILANSIRMNQSIGIIGDIIANQQKHAKDNLYIEEFDLESIINESLNIQKINFDKHFIQVTTDFELVPKISGDRAKLHQILSNIFINAQHALINNSEDNRLLNIKLFAEQQSIVIVIKDNGYGILQDSLTRIFQHGFTTKQNGHGFGLHSCANLIGEMGGQIEAHSDGPGQGASFVIKLNSTYTQITEKSLLKE